jgi:hypothetical protein
MQHDEKLGTGLIHHVVQLRGGHSLLLGETRKRVQGADSTCPCCREEEEDLEHVLRACPELESPRRRNFVRIPRRSRLCQRIRWRWHGSSGRSSSGTPRDRLPPTHTHTHTQGGLAMQHDEKLGTMKLMLYRQGGPNGYNILILIVVWPLWD